MEERTMAGAKTSGKNLEELFLETLKDIYFARATDFTGIAEDGPRGGIGGPEKGV
jgi:hypothetical protein